MGRSAAGQRRSPLRSSLRGASGEKQARGPWLACKTGAGGRGDLQLPYDLLVTDGIAVARLRHGAIRGRTNRHGFLCQCDVVRGASHRYWRHALERARCAVQGEGSKKSHCERRKETSFFWSACSNISGEASEVCPMGCSPLS